MIIRAIYDPANSWDVHRFEVDSSNLKDAIGKIDFPKDLAAGDVLVQGNWTFYKIVDNRLSKLDDVSSLRQAVPPCTSCSLHKTALRVCVPADVKKKNPAILILGMAPGREEDIENRPFVESAPAGGLMRRLVLNDLKIPPEEVAWTNIAKCFPTDEKGQMRDPTTEEMVVCSGAWLWNEILDINPTVIVPVGATSANFILGTNEKITSLRGRLIDLKIGEKIFKVLPAIHPSAVARGRADWYDLIKDDVRAAYRYATASKAMLPKWALLNDTDQAVDAIAKVLALYKEGYIKSVSIDIETDNPLVADVDSERVEHSMFDPTCKIVGFALAWDPSYGVFIPLYHVESKVDVVAVLSMLRRLLLTVPLNGHNLKFDESWFLAKHGMASTTGFDTMLASYVLHTVLRRHGLKGLLSDIFGWPPYDKVIWTILDQMPVEKRRFGSVPLDKVAEYCVYDTVGTLMLQQYFEPMLEENQSTRALDLLVRASDFFRNVEVRGATVDLKQLDIYEQHYKLAIDSCLMQLKDLSTVSRYIQKNKDFNPNSTPSIRSVLFETEYFGLPMQEDRTKGGELSVNEKVQHELIKLCMHYHFSAEQDAETFNCSYCGTVRSDGLMHPKPGRAEALFFLKTLRQIRKMMKITSYFKRFKQYTRPHSIDEAKKLGTITYNHKLHYTKTGRIQSSDMSIHTIPWHADPRRLIVAPWIREGGIVLSADYSQHELRILASLSMDPGLILAYKEGKDVHVFIASRVWRKEESQITTTLRRYSKTISFGIVFGEGAQTIAEQTGMTVKEADQAINRFLYEEFKGVGAFIETQHQFAKKHGYVRTPFDRILHIPEAKSLDKAVLAEGLRKAQNAPVQSTASDVTLEAAMTAERVYREAGLKSFIWAVIHDATECAIAPGELMKVLHLHKKAMEEDVRQPWMLVPLVTEFEVGARWDGGCKITKFGPDWIEVKGPDRFYQEFVETLNKGMSIATEEFKSKPRKLFEELVPKRAYEGDNGGDFDVTATLVLGANLVTV